MIQIWADQVESTIDPNACISFRYRSARDFLTFSRQGAEGAYDMMETPPHIASYLAQYHGWKIIAREAHEGNPIIITLASSSITKLQQLHNKPFGSPDAMAVVSVLAMQLFSERKPAVVPINRSYRHHNDVIEALIRQEIAAGVIFSPILSAYQKYTKDPLIILHTIPTPIDGYVIVSPGLKQAMVEKIHSALVATERQQENIWAPWLSVSEQEALALHKAMASSVKYLKKALENGNRP